MGSTFAKLKQWAQEMKGDILALWIAARDSRTPLTAKVVAAFVAAYALSPIDLIPDFIPLLGYLDDLILLPIGIVIAVRLIPGNLMREFRGRGRERVEKPGGRAGLVIVCAAWIASAACLAWLLWPERAN